MASQQRCQEASISEAPELERLSLLIFQKWAILLLVLNFGFFLDLKRGSLYWYWSKTKKRRFGQEQVNQAWCWMEIFSSGSQRVIDDSGITNLNLIVPWVQCISIWLISLIQRRITEVLMVRQCVYIKLKAILNRQSNHRE
jgi:hypothetical protein